MAAVLTALVLVRPDEVFRSAGARAPPSEPAVTSTAPAAPAAAVAAPRPTAQTVRAQPASPQPRSTATAAPHQRPSVPPVLGVAAGVPGATLRHAVPTCPVTWLTTGNRFDTVRDELKLRAMVLSAPRGNPGVVVTPRERMPPPLAAWLQAHNVSVVYAATEAMRSAVAAATPPVAYKARELSALYGTMLRYDAAALLLQQLPRFASPQSACDRFVLYSDSDVIFTVPGGGDAAHLATGPLLLSDLVDQLPPFAAATTEWTRGWTNALRRTDTKRVDVNTGVLLFNVAGIAAVAQPFAAFTVGLLRRGGAVAKELVQGTWDQETFNHFFNAATHGLLSKLVNWRLLGGYARAARLLHFQGIKCEDLLCTTEQPADATLALPRVGMSFNCSTARAWRYHLDSHLVSRIGKDEVVCQYRYVCRRALVDAATPFACSLRKLAKGEAPASTGHGFRLIGTPDAVCASSPRTCSLAVGRGTEARACVEESRVPPVLRLNVTAADGCAADVAVLVRSADDASAALETIRSLSVVDGVRRVLLVAAGGDEAAGDVAARIAGNNAQPRVAVIGVRPPAGGWVDAARAGSVAAQLPAALLEQGLVTAAAPDARTCATPLVVLVPPGAKIVQVPRLALGARLPTFVAVPRRCANANPWTLGASACAIDADTRVVLLNVLAVAGVADAVRAYLERTRGAAIDAVAGFFANAAHVLPEGWHFQPACGGPRDDVADVIVLPDGCGCGPAQLQRGAWPTQRETLTVRGCQRSAYCQRPGADCDATCS